MDHARDNVFACAALPLYKHRNIRAGQLGQAAAYSLHVLGATKHNRIGRHFPQRLHERIHTSGCHGYLKGGDFKPALQPPKPGRYTTDQLNLTYLTDWYQLTKAPSQRTLVIMARTLE
jgi:hypothetical protein